jgi:hypothetical protein
MLGIAGAARDSEFAAVISAQPFHELDREALKALYGVRWALPEAREVLVIDLRRFRVATDDLERRGFPV